MTRDGSNLYDDSLGFACAPVREPNRARTIYPSVHRRISTYFIVSMVSILHHEL
jgi:hypothetical protein